jgi:PAS domain-containing protein
MLSPRETADGRGVISVIPDISDRKRAQEAIRPSEQQFRALFEFSPRCLGYL